MKKNDLRIQAPLWNIAAALILLLISYVAIATIDQTLFSYDYLLANNDLSIEFFWNWKVIWVAVISTVLSIIFIITYVKKLSSHNKQFPHQRIAFFSDRPVEYIEEDEMFRQVTQKATQKVYSFYTYVIPAVIVIMLFPFDRYVFIFLLFAMIVIHNLLYYLEMRKLFKSTQNDRQLFGQFGKVKNKVLLFVITTCLVIITVGAVQIFRINSNAETNSVKAEECLKKNGTVVITEKKGLFSLTSYSCEKE